MGTFQEWVEERDKVLDEGIKDWLYKKLDQYQVPASLVSAIASALGFIGMNIYGGVNTDPSGKIILGLAGGSGALTYAAIEKLKSFLGGQPPGVTTAVKQVLKDAVKEMGSQPAKSALQALQSAPGEGGRLEPKGMGQYPLDPRDYLGKRTHPN